MLTDKQSGVVKGMVSAMLVSIITITAAVLLNPFSLGETQGIAMRLEVLGLSLILPTCMLILCIGRLARFRFFSAVDIDGSGLSPGSEQATLLQSLLQNTLEQLVIAAAVYSAWCFIMPVHWLSAIALCSLAFVVGRICFFAGYHRGAAARAFGFALSFYPTVLLMLTLMLYQLLTII